jgi:hypothetical protein
MLQAETWRLSGGVHHWLEEKYQGRQKTRDKRYYYYY